MILYTTTDGSWRRRDALAKVDRSVDVSAFDHLSPSPNQADPPQEGVRPPFE